jgi:hypothetical protein
MLLVHPKSEGIKAIQLFIIYFPFDFNGDVLVLKPNVTT